MTTTTFAPENYTFTYADGYTARAIEIEPGAYAVTMYAPNGDEGTFPSVREAEQWMLHHFHGQMTGHPMLCGCFAA